jgi:hypothetical protein
MVVFVDFGHSFAWSLHGGDGTEVSHIAFQNLLFELIRGRVRTFLHMAATGMTGLANIRIQKMFGFCAFSWDAGECLIKVSIIFTLAPMFVICFENSLALN